MCFCLRWAHPASRCMWYCIILYWFYLVNFGFDSLYVLDRCKHEQSTYYWGHVLGEQNGYTTIIMASQFEILINPSLDMKNSIHDNIYPSGGDTFYADDLIICSGMDSNYYEPDQFISLKGHIHCMINIVLYIWIFRACLTNLLNFFLQG